MLLGPGDFTYSGDPSSSAKDQVRFLIGDTDTDDMILTDAEVEWCIHNRGHSTNYYLAASDASDLAGHKYSRIINRQTGTLTLTMSSNNLFHERAKTLRQLAGETRIGPVLASDQLASEIANYGGRRPPIFWLGMGDNLPNNYDHAPSNRGNGWPEYSRPT